MRRRRSVSSAPHIRKRNVAIGFAATSLAMLGLHTEWELQEEVGGGNSNDFRGDLLFGLDLSLHAKPWIVPDECTDPNRRRFVDRCLKGVVKVISTSVPLEFEVPWAPRAVRTSAHSGVVLPKRRILTSASNLVNFAQVQLTKQLDPREFTGRVLAISYARDLALLTVDDDEFWKDVEPMEVGDIPAHQSTATHAAFIMNGRNLAVSQGVVANVEQRTLEHLSRPNLVVQTAAKTTEGSSGGPIFDGLTSKVTGIVSRQAGDHKYAYAISAKTIRRFLDEFEKTGTVSDAPLACATFKTLPNASLVAYHGLDKIRDSDALPSGVTAEGVAVMQVNRFPRDAFRRKMTRKKRGEPEPKASEHDDTTIDPAVADEYGLEKGDVVLAIDGHNLDNEGTYMYRDNHRLDFSALFEESCHEDVHDAVVLRNGRVKKIKLPVFVSNDLFPPKEGRPRPYFFLGGIVFLVGENSTLSNPDCDLLDLANRVPDFEDEEVVLGGKVMLTKMTLGFDGGQILKKVNGQRVRNLRHFTEIADAAMERVKLAEPNVDSLPKEERFITLEFSNDQRFAMDLVDVIKAQPNLMKLYRCPVDRRFEGEK